MFQRNWKQLIRPRRIDVATDTATTVPLSGANVPEPMYAVYSPAGARVFVEVGPGSVLTGLVSKILQSRPHVALSLDRKGKDGLTAWALGVARLAAAGVPMELASGWEGYREPENPHEVPQPKLKMAIKMGPVKSPRGKNG